MWKFCGKAYFPQSFPKLCGNYAFPQNFHTMKSSESMVFYVVKTTMEVKWLRTLAIEIFKTLNHQNHSFMKEILYQSPYVSHKKWNLFVQSHKTAAFGDKSIKTLTPQIWNLL